MAKRIKTGLSARQTSELSGLSPSYISKVESGELEPSFRAFCKIAKALGMSDAEILTIAYAQANDITVIGHR